MHDIDRAMFEGEYETESLEQEDFMDVLGGVLRESEGEAELSEGERRLSIGAEMELANTLLEISSEAELDRFLGDLANKALGAARTFIRSDVGQKIGTGLRTVARQALPSVGRAIGDYVVPGVGGDIGATIASTASDVFGLELEGLSQEDREYEEARAFVRFADDVIRAAAATPSTTSPEQAAQSAMLAAARRHAPGLLAVLTRRRPRTAGRGRGRWARRGQNIVIEL